ncbi:glycosyltransferase involved in cell wall biosynthesis [Kaistia dalseonensis]|uniref:Glycosyltransferase involved in cell wall biosynthesis n=1 Tax=Kaistia dalseonensis TaxID=410840 RepID=A0ABU0H1N7_9HYPH|nr:glycosyltransferase [Kaistia dalseonensis]MDQ0436202.1 glycosyltransferase involved in cell wall biosynthesis [Kaistia dalseonensis]
MHCFRSPVGGIFRHVRDLALAQIADGHSVGIVCDSSTGGAREEDLFREIAPLLPLGLNRVPMKRQISPTDFVALMRVFRSIKALNPDVIHTHGAKGGVYGRMIGTFLRVSGSRVARIYCPHGGSLHYDPRSHSGRVFFALERLMERITDAFVFVSRYEADAYAAKVGRPTKPWRIAPNGIRPEEFVPVRENADAADFLYIGMMRDLKGPDLFIDALARLRDQRGVAPTAEIVGDGPDKPRYVAKAERLGLSATTRFHDAMPARAAFATARIVVVPSRAESMPYIVLEAIAAGRPLVATRVGGIPEIFDAAADRLVRPGDEPALAEAMAALLDDPERAQMEAEALRASIEPRFSVEAMAANVAGLYSASLAR